MKVINLTPHPIVLRSPSGEDTVVEPSGTIARVATVPGEDTGTVVGGVPVHAADRPGEVTGLPDPQEDTIVIVSGLVGAALAADGHKCRSDIVVPGTGPADGAIRNERGHIVAVTRLKAVR